MRTTIKGLAGVALSIGLTITLWLAVTGPTHAQQCGTCQGIGKHPTSTGVATTRAIAACKANCPANCNTRVSPDKNAGGISCTTGQGGVICTYNGKCTN